MYTPLQIPYILGSDYSHHVAYTEEIVPALSDFAVCLWEMQPRSSEEASVQHVILADGCIDLVVDYDGKEIGYVGMSKTEFQDIVRTPDRHFGARLKPGAFRQLTGLPATKAMDTFLPLKTIDASFDADAFFARPFEEAKAQFKAYLAELVRGKEPDEFVQLFDSFSVSPPATTAELYQTLHLSPRQCQRNFMEHFGLTPRMVLAILRFQRCLALLTATEATPNQILETTAYYDQSHFIKDFKRNIGLTPFEYLHTQKMSHLYNTGSQLPVTMVSEPKQEEESTMQFNKTTVRILVRKDYAACFDFYTKTLGLVATYGDRSGPYTSLAVKAGEPACLSLFAAANMPLYKGYVLPSGNTAADPVEICIPTDDVDADYKRLKAAGVEFIGEPQIIEDWGGVRTVLFRDPEGNLLELSDGEA